MGVVVIMTITVILIITFIFVIQKAAIKKPKQRSLVLEDILEVNVKTENNDR